MPYTCILHTNKMKRSILIRIHNDQKGHQSLYQKAEEGGNRACIVV
jgi:hypothetical protein